MHSLSTSQNGFLLPVLKFSKAPKRMIFLPSSSQLRAHGSRQLRDTSSYWMSVLLPEKKLKKSELPFVFQGLLGSCIIMQQILLNKLFFLAASSLPHAAEWKLLGSHTCTEVWKQLADLVLIFITV